MTASTTQLDGKNVTVGRTIWGSLIALSALLFLATFPLYLQSINDFMSSPDATLPGMSVGTRVGLYLAVHLIYMIPVFIIALWIGIRLFDNWLGLFASAALALYAVGLNSPILSDPVPVLVKGLAIVGFVGTVGRLAIYFLLPDGQLRLPALVLIAVYAINVFGGAQLLPSIYTWISLGAWIISLLSLIYQYRRLQGADQKRQIKWVAISVVGILAATILALVSSSLIEILPVIGGNGILSLEIYQRTFGVIENLWSLFGAISLAVALLSTRKSKPAATTEN